MTFKLFALIVASLLILENNAKNKKLGKKHTAIVMARVYPPCFSYNLPMSFGDIKLRQTEDNVLVNYTLVLTEDITNKDLVMFIDFQRCRGAEALDTCMKFTTIRSPKLCSIMESENQVWSTFLSCLNPKLRCPFLKGTYVGKNCYFDMSHYPWFPLHGSYWKINVTVFDNNRLIYCAMVGGTTKEMYL